MTGVRDGNGNVISEIYPRQDEAAEEIPDRARAYLNQAIESLHTPAGAIMLAASSVDAMLKQKGYCENTLYARIDQAAADHVITKDMAAWAHEVRLDANEQRHADEQTALPTTEDASRCVEFTSALAEFMFVLPAKIARGRQDAGKGTKGTA